MVEETMIHPETGEILRRDVRPLDVTYKGETIVVNMPGWYPAEGDNEAIFSMDDMKVAGAALRKLKARYQKSLQVDKISNVALA